MANCGGLTFRKPWLPITGKLSEGYTADRPLMSLNLKGSFCFSMLVP